MTRSRWISDLHWVRAGRQSRSQRTQKSLLSAAAVLLVLGAGCGASEQPSSAPVAVPHEAFADGIPPDAALWKISDVIRRERERLGDVEGRKGILAEERLYSLFDEELIIRDFFQDRRGGFFLDVGCAWPTKSNNTYYLEKHLGWRGIGVDALEEYGPGWREKRPRSRFVSYLVTDRSGERRTFFRSANPGLSSTDRKAAAGGIVGDDLTTEEVTIETITLDDLLEREGVEKVDLLSMDIEGHEPAALAGFDIERWRPDLVVVEGQVAAERERAIRDYFDRHGYELLERYRPFDRVNRYFALREQHSGRSGR